MSDFHHTCLRVGSAIKTLHQRFLFHFIFSVSMRQIYCGPQMSAMDHGQNEQAHNSNHIITQKDLVMLAPQF